MGSTSLTANSSGGKVAELRYYPWGGTRFTSGTTPTSYQFTGQRNDAATYPAFGLYFYNYDCNGNMLTRVENGVSYTQGWDQENRLQTVTVNGATTTFTYDGDGARVKEVSYENVAAGIRATSSGTLNWPDVVTNGDTWADSGSGSSGEFAYTAQTGLHYVQLDLGAVYSVDKVRVWHYAADGRIYNATKTQVSADGTTWYTVFDSAVSGTYAETAAGRTYTFAARNVRYVRDYLNGSNVNAGNHWVEIEVWGTRTTVYVGAHYEKNVTANTTTSYYYLGSQRVAQRAGGVVYYLHADYLGSASLTTDASGNKVGELRYLPYGETRTIWGITPTDRRFTGQIEDAAIDLYFYNARYYDPALGRFIQADTIVPSPANPQSLNRYAYAVGNPLRYIDPTGHAYCPPEAGSRCMLEDEPPPQPLPIRFVGNWSAAARMQVIRGAQAYAEALLKVFIVERSRHPGTSSALTEAIAPQNMPLSAQSAFRMVFGRVTFRVVPQCAEKDCNYGVNEGAWAWSRIADLGEVWVNVNALNVGSSYNGFAGALNTVHELGHGLDQLGGGQASRNLAAAWTTYSLQRSDGGFAGGFPWQQAGRDTAHTASEVYADMSIGWTYSRWGDNAAGKARSRYMQANMPAVIALTVKND
ncbi:MAG: RHS repeat-associated core domain-containing protein [Anaerolineae bacterium]